VQLPRHTVTHPLDATTMILDSGLSRKMTTQGHREIELMSRLVKRIAIAFVVAALAVPVTASAATADDGGSANAGPRCCF
jgi:hypothetical protein